MLKLRGLQKVDVTALVQSVSLLRDVTTRLGQRVVVDVAIVDDSVLKKSEANSDGTSERVCNNTFAMFFASTAAGWQELARLQELMAQNDPVSFLNLTCTRESGDTVKFSTGVGSR